VNKQSKWHLSWQQKIKWHLLLNSSMSDQVIVMVLNTCNQRENDFVDPFTSWKQHYSLTQEVPIPKYDFSLMSCIICHIMFTLLPTLLASLGVTLLAAPVGM
jgi:hypothetical protein